MPRRAAPFGLGNRSKTRDGLAKEERLEEMVAYRTGAAVTDHLFRGAPEQGRLAPPRRGCIT
jgi:hypothetical protein